MSTETLARWKSIVASGSGVQRGFDDHPLRLHYGVDTVGRPIFFLRTSSTPPTVGLSDVVEVEVRERPAFDEWMLLLTLRDLKYEDTFMDLCLDLAGRAGKEATEEAALQEFFRALDQFDDLFKQNRGVGLSDDELRGLFAELWFALRIAAPETDHSEALRSWKGPYKAPQDFRLDNGELFEIKATHVESSLVTVSSADQLDPSSSDHMTLAVISLEECAVSGASGSSLAELIDQFAAGLAAEGEDRAGLDDRLNAVGFQSVIDGERARYEVACSRFFDVRDGFPRVDRSSVPDAVDSLKYQIRISKCIDFEIDLPTDRFRLTKQNTK